MTSANTPQWRPALFAEQTNAGKVRCTLCPFRCVLADGQTGVCQVRRNRSGRLETATYAITVAHLTSIERKPLYHVRPGSRVLTIAGPGCSFRCDYCINYRISQYGREDSAPWTGELARPAEIAARAKAEGALLGLSYSEPGLAPELTLALAEYGLPLVWKTNGYMTAHAIDAVAPALTAVNIDIKAAGEAEHRRLTGASLGPVWSAIERFRSDGVWVEVSTPLIPGTSADPGALRSIAKRLASIDPDLPWHLLRFTPDFRLRQAAPTTPDTLRQARDVGHQTGLRYVYVERALGPGGRVTKCPECLLTLVARGIWETVENFITDGRCPRCGLAIPGRW